MNLIKNNQVKKNDNNDNNNKIQIFIENDEENKIRHT